MKKSVALIIAASAAAVCHAESSPAGQPAPHAKMASMQKEPAFKPRQLSAEERAQLRRQLVEYSRLAGK